MANKHSNHIGLNKFSFYTLLSMAVLYLIATVLRLIGLATKLVPYLQGVATAIAIGIVGYIAWRYVDGKSTAWKILYVIILLVVLVGIILPLI